MTAAGNLSLGINAHIQRDLPFVLAGIGLVKPDGSSRKPDHDRVNVFLNRVTDDLYAEIARRFDPTIDDADLPGAADSGSPSTSRAQRWSPARDRERPHAWDALLAELDRSPPAHRVVKLQVTGPATLAYALERAAPPRREPLAPGT